MMNERNNVPGERWSNIDMQVTDLCKRGTAKPGPAGKKTGEKRL